MAIENKAASSASLWEKFTICLPHPYLTKYIAKKTSIDQLHNVSYQLSESTEISENQSQESPPAPLHNPSLHFSSLTDGHDIPLADNTPWARAPRSPSLTFKWTSIDPSTVAQLWLLIYSCFTVCYSEECIRLNLVGTQASLIRNELISVGLAISHPGKSILYTGSFLS
jgi:hypothetical protein